jgi:hypothetical protein
VTNLGIDGNELTPIGYLRNGFLAMKFLLRHVP